MSLLRGRVIPAKAKQPPTQRAWIPPMCGEPRTQRWPDFTTGAKTGQLEKAWDNWQATEATNVLHIRILLGYLDLKDTFCIPLMD